MIETGWCVDATGIDAGRNPSTQNVNTEDDCFKLCLEDPYLTGCTFMLPTTCFTYTHRNHYNIKRGSGNIGYKCYHRKGINFISFLCFEL